MLMLVVWGLALEVWARLDVVVVFGLSDFSSDIVGGHKSKVMHGCVKGVLVWVPSALIFSPNYYLPLVALWGHRLIAGLCSGLLNLFYFFVR